MKKLVSLVLVNSLLIGCSAFRPSKEQITVMTNQPDAKIFVNGQQIGQGTASAKVRRSRNVQIMASKPGYQTVYYNIDSNINVTGVLDIIGTFVFLFPMIGVFCPGFKSLDENNVALNLDPMVPVQ